MFSILIPVYNYNATTLVFDIHEQASKLQIDFEIICVDDASKSLLNKENEKINSLENAVFFSNEKNLGFSSNRNFLASISKFNNLLFIDGDSVVINNHFIKNYIDLLSNEIDIVSGGRIHQDTVENKNQLLRWKYGRFVEDKFALKRNKNRFKTLMFNNTLIKKNIFNSIKFSTFTDTYGHDDTLFAYKASLVKLNVLHIDNAIMHNDIDSNEDFIKKTEIALNNLFHLYKLGKIDSSFVKILKLYKVLDALKTLSIISFLFKISKPLLSKQLKSDKPSLFLFNLYKLGHLCQIKFIK